MKHPLFWALCALSFFYLCYNLGKSIDENGLKDFENQKFSSFDTTADEKWLYGTESIRGRRAEQEDRVLIVSNQTKFGLFGVFDGHGGSGASEFAATNFYPIFSSRIAKGERLRKALEMAVLDVEDKFMRKAYVQEWYSGTTACVAVVTSQAVTVASVGDSKALVCASRNGNESIQLTSDDRPELPEERRRIAGGFVEFGRVNGGLAVSRAIGDMELKPYVVIAQPHIVEYRRNLKGGEMYYLVVASDGVFEKLSHWDVCSTIFRAEEALPDSDLSSLASMVVNQALQNGSYDNLSVILVPL